MTRSLTMAALGLLLGMIGIDTMTGLFRFDYGIVELGDGIGIVPVAVGLFGISEILLSAGRATRAEIHTPRLRELLPSRQEWRRARRPIGRGTVLGFLIGIIPGPGHVISSFVSYSVERRLSKHPERFGQGAVEGVAGPESANNSATSGAFVPMLALGLPSGAVPAIMLAAMMIHGIAPGPLLIQQQPQLFWGVIASMYVGQRGAAHPEPAPRRALREYPAHPVFLPVPVHPRLRHARRVRGEQQRGGRVDHGRHRASWATSCASSTSRSPRSSSAWCWRPCSS